MNLRKKLQQYVALNSYVEKITSALPVGYTKLEYIASTGTQYIDTGFVLSLTDKIAATIEYTAKNSTDNFVLCARGDSSTGAAWADLYGSTTSNWYVRFGSLTSINGATGDYTNQKINLELYTEVFKINGEQKLSPVNDGTITTNSLIIFAGKNSSGSIIGISSLKMYAFTIVDNTGKLKMNLVPAKNSAGVIGMYDTISSTFLTNTGTGTFVAGPAIATFENAIHSGLKEITTYGKITQPSKDYLDTVTANGATEFISETLLDTVVAKGKTEIQRSLGDYIETDSTTNIVGVKIDTGIAADVDDMIFEIKVKPSTGSWYIFQARENNPIWGVNGSTNSNTILAGWNGTQNIMSSSLTRNNTHTYFIRLAFKNGNGTLYVKDLTSDEENTQTCTYTYTSGTTNNIYLFGNSTGDTLGSGNVIYYAKLYKSGELVGYYIPAKDNQNVAGFYDAISGTFKTPTNGSLTAGEEITTPIADPYCPVDIVCNNGKVKISSNEFDPDAVELGYYRDKANNGAKTSASYNFLTGYMPVKPNTSYVLYGRKKSNNGLSSYNRIHWFDSDLNYISTNDYTKDTIGKGTSPANAAYAQGSINESGGTSTATTQEIIDSYNWTFREGTAEQAFVKFGIVAEGQKETLSDTLGNTSTCENLFQTHTDYQDSQSVLDGVISRACRVKILNGGEVWNTATGHDNAFIGLFLTDKISGAAPAPICSHFKPTSAWTEFDKPEVMSMILTNSNSNCVIKMVGIDTVADFKEYLRSQYLAGTPVLVVYTLAETTTENVNKQYLRKSPVSVTQGSLPNLEITTTESLHTTPSPDHPLNIRCNNGTLQKSPNLFNKNNYEEIDGYVDGSTGVLTVASGASNIQRCVVIDVKPNTHYQITGILNSNYGTFQTKTVDSVATTYATGDTILTTGPNDKYIIGLVRTTNGTYDYLDTLDVYEINNNTRYIVSGTQEILQDNAGTINTATCEDLFGAGTYADTQEILTGTITRNVGILILDGVNNKISTTWNATYKRGNITLNDIKRTPVSQADCYCSHFKYDATVNGAPTTAGFCSRDTDSLVLFCFLGMDNITSPEDANAWFADQYAKGTPVMIVYPLATATTESVSAQTLVVPPVSIKQASMSNLTVDTTQAATITPTPNRPLALHCNNGIIKPINEEKFTTEGEDVGYIISASTGIISENENYNVTDGIWLEPGSYTATCKFTVAGSSRYFTCYSYEEDKTTPIAQIFSTTGTTTDLQTIEFTITNRCLARVSYRNSALTDMSIVYHNIVDDNNPEILTVYSKNLFDKTDIVEGYYISSTGVIRENTDFCYSGLIPVEAGKIYTWSFYRNSIGSARRWHGYDSNGDWVCQLDVDSSATVGGKYYTVTIPSGVAYTRLSIMQNELNTNQIEMGSRPTTYEPYGKTQLDVQSLFGFGDYVDTQDLISGIVNRKIGVKVFDGTETFINGTNGWISETAITDQINANYIPFCTHFVGTDNTPAANSNTVRVYRTSQNVGRIYFGVDKTLPEFATNTAFQQWMADQYAAGTPIIVAYALNTPVTETVEGQYVGLTAGNSDLERKSDYISDLNADVDYLKLR
ncbi:MAG: hypothetical protein J5691_00640 [Bacilli bacterium]|nr:hypothetical protein [Bacilli bacterium]